MVISNILYKPYLEPGEEVLEIFHRHPFVLVPELGRIFLFGFVVPFGFYILFPQFVLFYALWMLISVVRIFYAVLTWYYDSLLITNLSLLEVKWGGFFNRTSTRLEYNMIEGVTTEAHGFLSTVFNFGLLKVQGGAGLILKEAINPRRIERKVIHYQEKFVSHQNLKDSETLKTLLSSMLKHHAKTQGIPENPVENKPAGKHHNHK